MSEIFGPDADFCSVDTFSHEVPVVDILSTVVFADNDGTSTVTVSVVGTATERFLREERLRLIEDKKRYT